MKDRVPQNPGRMKITHADGTSEYVTLERADNPTQIGTPLNKNTLFDSTVNTRYGLEDGTPSQGFSMLTKEWTVSIPASGWSATPTNGWYTNRISVSGMKAVYSPLMSLIVTSSDLVSDEQSAFGAIAEAETFDGYIIVKASYVPDISINVRLKGV
jgi:hypothetical protein|nr:MAG TPA: hypothetical protein [Caudoviricetes sp.]